MRRYVITVFGIALTLLNVELTLLASAQNESAVKLKDPGFESFKLARGR